MRAETVSKSAQARCYKCGSPDIECICHHCGRSMCKDHSHNYLPAKLGMWNALAIKLGWKTLSDPEFKKFEPGFQRLNTSQEVYAAFGLGKVVNPEFSGFAYEPVLRPDAGSFERFGANLRSFKRKFSMLWGNQLSDTVAVSRHCEFCSHSVMRHPVLTWFGLLLCLTVIGSPIGIVLLVWGFLANQSDYIQAQLKQFPPLPLEGDIKKITVQEQVSGEIKLDAVGDYLPSKEEATGHLSIPVTFGSTIIDRYRAYQLKAKDLGMDIIDSQNLHAGFLLTWPASWEFTAGDIWLPGRMNVIELHTPLRGSPVEPLLTNPDVTDAKWEVDYAYHIPDKLLREGRQGVTLPVQVVVSIIPESNRQAMALELELIAQGDFKPVKASIEEFTLYIPNALGRIERLEPEGRIDETGAGYREGSGLYQSIVWRKLSFESQRRCPILIQFQNPIDLDARLEGYLEVRTASALSGASGIDLFSAGGMKNEKKPPFEAETIIKVDLDLDLSGLRYQTLKLVEKKILREGVVPDARMITELADAISEQEFYVKRITENPARTSKEGAHKINRYWDIQGRKYEGVYPVDFHVVLTGEEEIHGKSRLSVGQLQVEISAQGAVTNPDMGELVQNVSDQLSDLTHMVLDKIPLVSRAGRVGLPAPATPEHEPKIEYVQTDGMPVEVIDTQQPRVEILKPLISEDYQATVKDLQRKLDQLEERLLDGKLSEETYLSLKVKYEQMLWDNTGGQLGQPADQSTSRRRSRK